MALDFNHFIISLNEEIKSKCSFLLILFDCFPKVFKRYPYKDGDLKILAIILALS